MPMNTLPVWLLPNFTPVLTEFPHQGRRRCFLSDCPCDSTSPQEAIIIDVEASTAIKARQNAVLVYRCGWNIEHSPCSVFIEGTRKEILSHLKQCHGIMHDIGANIGCCWDSCSMAGALKMDSVARHIARHLGIKSRCSRCGCVMARDDVIQAHIRKSPECTGGMAQVVPGPGAQQIVSVY
ncbi:hypothetical protein DFH29DRAFT_900230 [Suillus ampliporus]|nr:hypothetical protein DFH29DRAFT_900230 [Suillus ampliporus]